MADKGNKLVAYQTVLDDKLTPEQAKAKIDALPSLTRKALDRTHVTYPAIEANNYNAVEPGNIDLANRPYVRNPDGSVSTVLSVGANVDGREVLMPSVNDRGYIMTPDEAIAEYRRTGRHMGIYRNARESDAAGQAIHEDQMRNPPKDTLRGNGGYRNARVADAAEKAQDDIALDDFRNAHFDESTKPPPSLDDFRRAHFDASTAGAGLGLQDFRRAHSDESTRTIPTLEQFRAAHVDESTKSPRYTALKTAAK